MAKGLVQVLLQGYSGFHCILSFAPLILGKLLHDLEKGAAIALVLHLQEMLVLLSQFMEEVVHVLQSHVAGVELEAQREVGIRGLQMHVDQVVDGGFHLTGIILPNLGAHGCLATTSKLKKWCRLVLEADDG